MAKRVKVKIPLVAAEQTLESNLEMARGFLTLHLCFGELVRGNPKQTEKTKDFLPLLLFFGYKLSDLASGYSPEAAQHDLEFIRKRVNRGLLHLNREPTEAEQETLGEDLAASWRARTGRREYWFPSKEEAARAGTALRRGLLAQCLLISASAFEGYVKDITAAAVSSSATIRRRFYDEALKKGGRSLTVGVLEQGPRAYATFVASLIGPLTPNAINRHFHRLLDTRVQIFSAEDATSFERMMEYRHLIAHRAGVVDGQFKRRVRCQDKIGSAVSVSPELAETSIDAVSRITSRIQACTQSTVLHPR